MSAVETKIGSRKIPDFSFISSLNLLKSRVFATNIMGLSFPALRVEQAHFSPLTTCLTTCGDFWLLFGSFKAVIAVHDYRLKPSFVVINITLWTGQLSNSNLL